MERLILAYIVYAIVFAAQLGVSASTGARAETAPPGESVKPSEQAPQATSSQEQSASANKVSVNEAAMKADAVLLSKLSAPGWEAAPIEAFENLGGALQTPDGRTVTEVSGVPAELLLEFGCTNVTVRQFKRGQRTCTVKLFRFSTTDGAYGAYTNLRVGASTVIARGDASSEDDDSISFWKGHYFISLSTNADGDDEAKGALTAFANKIVIADSAKKPALLSQLPVLEKTAGSERFYKGPFAANQHLPLPFLNSLSLDKSAGAVSAVYQFPQPYSERLKLLIVDYAKPSAAKAMFGSFTGNLRSLDKILEDEDGHMLCKLNGSYLMCQTSGTQVSVIWGARKKYAPGMLSRQLGRYAPVGAEH